MTLNLNHRINALLRKLKPILLSNVALAFFLTLPLLFVVPQFINKYEIDLQGPVNMYMYDFEFYHDLNHDGNSDLVYFGRNQVGELFCKVYDPAHRGQHNADGALNEFAFTPYFADVNGGGADEIAFFSLKDSSIICLHIVDYLTEEKRVFELGEVGFPGKRDFGASIIDYADFDRDGKKEYLIKLTAGFGLQPRALYLVSPDKGVLKRTPVYGSKLGPIRVVDLDKDGFLEILAGATTSENYDKELNFPYDDNSTRLFLFDHHLQYQFEPIEFSRSRSGVITMPFVEGDSTFIYAYLDLKEDIEKKNRHYLISTSGEIIRSAPFPKANARINMYPTFVKIDDQYHVFDNEGMLSRITKNLDLIPVKKLTEYAGCHLSVRDVDQNGTGEMIFTNANYGIITICDRQFKHPVSFNLQGKQVFWITPIVRKNESTHYVMRTENDHYHLTYRKNRLWPVRHLFLVGVFGVIWFLFWLGGRIQRERIEEKLRVEREVQQLQYKAITSRFTPHYTFNVLNSISSHVYNSENPKLYNYFSKFIRQLRYLYDDQNTLTRSLKEEVEFCRDYLDIQKMRFPEKFDYEISLNGEKGLDVQIPKMLLHTFVENAFKHGLRPYDSGGKITLKVEASGKAQTTVSITDNGIGRAAARQYAAKHPEFSTGKGLQMMKELISLMNQGSRKEKIRLESEDLYDGDAPAGTQVRIILFL